MDIKKVILDEVFYLKFRLPEYVFNAIKNEVYEIAENKFKDALPYNYHLAGKIEHEYVLFKSAEILNDFFSHDRFKKFGGKRLRLMYSHRLNEPTQKLPSLWVNYQQKHEYNPLHHHDGDVSFVVWVNIPYSLEKEKKMPHSQSGTVQSLPAFTFFYSPSPLNSSQRFHVTNHRIEVDKSYEGSCILFPSNLQHMVTPFYTSDDYRISVSGNFVLEDD